MRALCNPRRGWCLCTFAWAAGNNVKTRPLSWFTSGFILLVTTLLFTAEESPSHGVSWPVLREWSAGWQRHVFVFRYGKHWCVSQHFMHANAAAQRHMFTDCTVQIKSWNINKRCISWHWNCQTCKLNRLSWQQRPTGKVTLYLDLSNPSVIQDSLETPIT